MEKVFTFDFNAPAFTVTKSYTDDSGQRFLEGVAATTTVDLTGERMSPEVLLQMAKDLIGKPLRDEHQKGWHDKLGEIVAADVIDKAGTPALWIKARLYDWSSKARDLFDLLKDGTQKMGLSVAGKINPGGLVKELVSSAGKYIPTYKDVSATEVSVTDHPANLDTFAEAVAKSLNLDEYDPAGFIKELQCNHEVDTWQGCEHQKCMVKGCANACEKCNEMGKMDVGAAGDIPNSKLARQDLAGKPKKESTETEKADSKPKEYGDVKAGDFLDPENYKYPADDKHLMPALRYFNHSGQRSSGGYDDAKWATMGKRLAAKLNKMTGDQYTYDPQSEKVVRGEDKSSTEKEVNDMANYNLVAKTVPDDVKAFVAGHGKTVEKREGDKAEETVTKTAEVKTEVVEKGSSSSDSSTSSGSTGSVSSFPTLGADSSSGSSDSSTSSGSDSSSTSSGSDSSSTSSGSDKSSTSKGSSSSDVSSEISSLMSELQSTLESINSSLSSSSDSSSDSSTSSGSSDSSSGSGSSTSGSSKSSTSKAEEVDETADAIDQLVKAADTMKELAKKIKDKKIGGKPNLKEQNRESGSDYSSSDNVTGSVESSAASSASKSANGGEVSPKGAKPKLKDEDSESASSYAPSDNSTGAGSTSTYGKSVDTELLTNALGLMKEMQKSIAKRDEAIEKLVAAAPARKGFALQKNFSQAETVLGTEDAGDEDLLEKMKNDPDVSFAEYHKYRDYQILPKKYAKLVKN